VLSRADVIRVGTEEFRFYADVTGAVGAPTPAAGARPVAPPAGAKPSAPAKPAPDTRPLFAQLEVISGVAKGTQHSLHTPLAHVGRGAHNDIVVDDDSVSDSHAKLQRRDDGWYVVDMDSTNGTYVGGQRIVGEKKLEGAPDLRFGGIKMIFRPKDTGPSDVKGTRAIAPIDPINPSVVKAPAKLRIAISAGVRESSHRRVSRHARYDIAGIRDGWLPAAHPPAADDRSQPKCRRRSGGQFSDI